MTDITLPAAWDNTTKAGIAFQKLEDLPAANDVQNAVDKVTDLPDNAALTASLESLAAAADTADDKAVAAQASADNAMDYATLKQFRKTIDVYQSSAVGDGITNDTVALQNSFQTVYGPAVETLLLDLGDNDSAVFLVDDTILNSNLKAVIIKGAGTIKRANNMIVNVDGDNDNFTPLIRIAGAPFVNFSGTWKIDGNRDGQVYPATDTQIGRGTLPWRHNGDIEICPSQDNTTKSKNIRIEFGGGENAYLNTLVLWQCEDVNVTKTAFKNTTWNGISGAGCTDVTIAGKNTFTRCGASDDFDTEKRQGDRGGIQFREFAIDFTSASEGIPCIVTGEFASGGVNRGINIISNNFVECGVVSAYLRAAFSSVVSNNISRNVGYKRLDSVDRYLPAHIWLEGGEYTAIGNEIYQDQVLSGDQRPDGMRITSLVGDATALFPAQGEYRCNVNNNKIVSAKNPADGVSYGYFNYGIRTNGYGDYSNNTVDGTQDYSIFVQNSASFAGDVLPGYFNADGCTLVNTDLGSNGNTSAIQVARFGTDTSGEVKNISAKNVTLNQSLSALSINSNLSAFAKVNISHGIGDIFSRYTESADQTLSSGFKVKLTHGFGELPKLVQPILKCLSNNGGWQTNDECEIWGMQTADGSEGIMIGSDSIGTTIIVGSAANPIKLLNRAGGSEGNIFTADLTKWALFLRWYV